MTRKTKVLTGGKPVCMSPSAKTPMEEAHRSNDTIKFSQAQQGELENIGWEH
ncbi:MAG: hypothetical protein K6A82_06280 [Prevotella sp.]|nr:hypothetical protein [Prevotella sp.]